MEGMRRGVGEETALLLLRVIAGKKSDGGSRAKRGPTTTTYKRKQKCVRTAAVFTLHLFSRRPLSMPLRELVLVEVELSRKHTDHTTSYLRDIFW
jgi:hypothetical protein